MAFSYDKMTEKRRSGQMTAIAPIIPKPEVPPDKMMQTFFVDNRVVRNHTAVGLSKSVAAELLKLLGKILFWPKVECMYSLRHR